MSKYVEIPRDRAREALESRRLGTVHDVLIPARQSFYVSDLDHVGHTRYALDNNGGIVDHPIASGPQRVILRRSSRPVELDEQVLGSREPVIVPPGRPEVVEPVHRVQVGYQTDERGNDTTPLYYEHSPIRFRQFDWPQYSWYFPGTSTTYHGSLLDLLTEHFRRGTVETALHSWLSSLNMSNFYPAGQPARSPNFSAFPGKYLVRRQHGKDDEFLEFPPIEHVIDWTGNYVAGVAKQARTYDEVELLRYGPVVIPAEDRTRTMWITRYFGSGDWDWIGLWAYLHDDKLPENATGRSFWIPSLDKGTERAFRIEVTYTVHYDEYVIPGGVITGGEETIMGELYIVDRSHGQPVGVYAPAYRIVFFDESNYCTASVNEWNEPIFEYFDGPYSELEFNIPLMADGDRIIVVRYSRTDRCRPHPKYPDTSQIYPSSCTVQFFSVDLRLRDWREITLRDYRGKLVWPDGAFDPSRYVGVRHGNFCFAGDDPAPLITPWVYRGRLYVHGPTGPLLSISTREYAGSDVRHTTFRCGSNILAFPLEGGVGVPVGVDFGNSVWSMPECSMMLRSRQFATGDVSIELGADMNRMFVGDKNWKLRQTSEV